VNDQRRCGHTITVAVAGAFGYHMIHATWSKMSAPPIYKVDLKSQHGCEANDLNPPNRFEEV
jgi:hypothetical protein